MSDRMVALTYGHYMKSGPLKSLDTLGLNNYQPILVIFLL